MVLHNKLFYDAFLKFNNIQVFSKKNCYLVDT